MTPRTPQCEVFWALLLSSKHSGVPEDSKSSLFPSVGLHPHTWPKWGCDNDDVVISLLRFPNPIVHTCTRQVDTQQGVIKTFKNLANERESAFS
jgi:hypothetical protein